MGGVRKYISICIYTYGLFNACGVLGTKHFCGWCPQGKLPEGIRRRRSFELLVLGFELWSRFAGLISKQIRSLFD